MSDENEQRADRPAGADRRAEDVLRRILADAHAHERSVFSEKTYADEPILTTGADFKRIRREQEERRKAADAADRRRDLQTRAPHGSPARSQQPTATHGRPTATPHPETAPLSSKLRRSATGSPQAASASRADHVSASRSNIYGSAAPEPIPPRASGSGPARSGNHRAQPAHHPATHHANRRNVPVGNTANPSARGGGATAGPERPRDTARQTRLAFGADEPFEVEAVPTPEPSQQAPLPAELRHLRDLEPVHRLGMTRKEEAQLFVRQAKLAAGFTDDAPYLGIVPYHRSATYHDLNDRELRGYFTWRTRWLAGEVSRIPNTYARIRAAEIVNGIAVEPGAAGLDELQRLQAASAELDKRHMGPDIAGRFAQWVRDYAIVSNLDATALVPESERTFAHAVAVLQRAERATLETGYRPQPAPAGVPDGDRTGSGAPTDSPAAEAEPAGESGPDPAAPTDLQVWHALDRVADYHVEKSPFLRTHEAQAAAVAAVVFERLVNHCALHSRVGFTEALVGRGSHRLFTPFLGLPYVPDGPQPDLRVQLSDAAWAVRKDGRWRIRQSYRNTQPNKQLHAMIHAIDRHMRQDWGAGRPLKARALPERLDQLIAEASAQVRKRETEQAAAAEAEKRRLTFDLSKLGGIRADAAVTRDALLVDEEIDEEPQAPALSLQQTSVGPSQAFGQAGKAAPATSAPAIDRSEEAPPTSGTEPASSTSTAKAAADSIGLPATDALADSAPGTAGSTGDADDATRPFGLSDRELAVLRRILAGEPFDDLLGPGAPMESVLIDAINEKLFDEIGDAVIEYADDTAHIIPDYREDVTDLLQQ